MRRAGAILAAFRLALICAFAAPAGAQAQISLPAILSDNAVFQAGQPVPVWGRTRPGALVTAAFGMVQARARADADGAFMLRLPPMPADATPRSLILSTDAGDSRQVQNILVGEVWLAAGQSNMVFELENAEGGQAASLASDDPGLRLFRVAPHQPLTPAGDVEGRWIVVRPGAARGFSAIGYFFGRRLREASQAPVGVVQSALGGTRIEAWTPEAALDGEARNQLDAARADQRARRAAWMEAADAWIDAARPADLLAIDPPVWPFEADSKNTPTVLYNGMVAPLAPYALKGVLWYQGESNRRDGARYAGMLRAMIAAWRARWGQALPFGLVQIAPFAPYPEFRDIWQAQLEVARDPGVGLVVVTDLADHRDIHPRRKREVGERLAGWALRDVYGRTQAAYVGPLFADFTQYEDRVDLAFAFDEGLTTRAGAILTGFEIETGEGRFVPVQAQIREGRVEVRLPQGPGPFCRLRYEWSATADPRLTNASGLPASPFQADLCGSATRLEPAQENR